MTTIAWDGTTLAADRAMSHGGTHYATSKLVRSRGHLLGASGTSALCRHLHAWFEAGADPEKWPKEASANDTYTSMLAITPDGSVLLYSGGGHPIPLKVRTAAIGSGHDFALAAMDFGKTAAEAVAYAATRDSGTGGGVDTLVLAEQPEPSLWAWKASDCACRHCGGISRCEDDCDVADLQPAYAAQLAEARAAVFGKKKEDVCDLRWK